VIDQPVGEISAILLHAGIDESAYLPDPQPGPFPGLRVPHIAANQKSLPFWQVAGTAGCQMFRSTIWYGHIALIVDQYFKRGTDGDLQWRNPLLRYL